MRCVNKFHYTLHGMCHSCTMQPSDECRGINRTAALAQMCLCAVYMEHTHVPATETCYSVKAVWTVMDRWWRGRESIWIILDLVCLSSCLSQSAGVKLLSPDSRWNHSSGSLSRRAELQQECGEWQKSSSSSTGNSSALQHINVLPTVS